VIAWPEWSERAVVEVALLVAIDGIGMIETGWESGE
jgi:hypothetical protein